MEGILRVKFSPRFESLKPGDRPKSMAHFEALYSAGPKPMQDQRDLPLVPNPAACSAVFLYK